MISSGVVSENPSNMATIYSEHSQQLKRSRLQEKFCVAAFLIRNLCSETVVFFDFKILMSTKTFSTIENFPWKMETPPEKLWKYVKINLSQ